MRTLFVGRMFGVVSTWFVAIRTPNQLFIQYCNVSKCPRRLGIRRTPVKHARYCLHFLSTLTSMDAGMKDSPTHENQDNDVTGGIESSHGFIKESHDQVCMSDGGAESLSHDQEPPTKTDHPYAYFNKGYTTEIFKIELHNIPPQIGYGNIKKLLLSLKLKPGKIKKPESKRNMCYINFRCEEERQAALKALNGYQFKNKTLSAKEAAPAPDPLFKKKKKRQGDELEELSQTKKARLERWKEMTLDERLAEAVTPMLSVPYSEQLQRRWEFMEKFLKKAAWKITHRDNHPGEWFTHHMEQHNGMMCRLEPVRPSPVQTEYRNKCEFSIGVSMATDPPHPVVGFRLGSYEKGEFTVVAADSCVHIPERMKELARMFQEYFCQSSLPPFDSRTETGYWRMVAVRCYTSGESMVIVQMHPQQLSQEELSEEKKKLKDFFTTGEGSKSPPTSLFFQALGRRTNTPPLYEHLFGEKHVHENLLSMKFRISPDAFFQVNTRGTEVLYSLVKELCTSKTDQRPVIYDICCGTGTIGIYLTKALSAWKLIGIEMVEQAIDDAKVNAQINGIDQKAKVEFLCGKAEDVMPDLQKSSAWLGEIIGVVDPPRGGLHPRVVEAIRKCAAIQKLVYISCNPDGVLQNFVDLCRRPSNRIKGAPFRPVSATPVDLFPHTHHCEVVILLERLKPHELKPAKQVRPVVSGVDEIQTNLSVREEEVPTNCESLDSKTEADTGRTQSGL